MNEQDDDWEQIKLQFEEQLTRHPSPTLPERELTREKRRASPELNYDTVLAEIRAAKKSRKSDDASVEIKDEEKDLSIASPILDIPSVAPSLNLPLLPLDKVDSAVSPLVAANPSLESSVQSSSSSTSTSTTTSFRTYSRTDDSGKIIKAYAACEKTKKVNGKVVSHEKEEHDFTQ